MSVCRISIQADLDEGRVVDMAVCARTPVGALLPAIVDVFGHRSAPGVVHGWRLDRVLGAPLDESLSLTDNDVHHGDLLVLTPTHTPPLGPVGVGPAREVASAGDPGVEKTRCLREYACASAALVAAVALAWTGPVTGAASHLIVAACGACVVCWTAVVRRSAVLAVAGCALTATVGFLGVPSPPGAPNVFLSAMGVFAVAVVTARLSVRPSPAVAATATCAALLAVAMAAPVFTALPMATIGAVLATAALGVLAIAPRLSTAMTGLGSRGEPEPPDALVARALTAHATLTGVVAGCAVAVATGTMLVTLGGVRAEVSQVAGEAFGFATGLVLLLRARTYVDGPRRAALVTGGLFCASAAFAVVVAGAPERAGWAALCLMAVGLGALRRPKPTPFVTRIADLLDYAALAAVVPLSCWVIGVYALGRGWQFA